MGFTLDYEGPAGEFEYSISGEPAEFADRERGFAQAIQPAVTALVGACEKDQQVKVAVTGHPSSVSLSFAVELPAEQPPAPVPGEQAPPPDTPGTPPDQSPSPPEPTPVATPDPGTGPAGDAQASPDSATVADAEQSGQDGAAS